MRMEIFREIRKKGVDICMQHAKLSPPSTEDVAFVPLHAPVAQLDRASDYGSEGLGFESLRAC